MNLANNFKDGGWHDCKNRGQDFDQNDVAMKAEPSYKKSIRPVCQRVKMRNTSMLLLSLYFSVSSVFIVCSIQISILSKLCSFEAKAMHNIVFHTRAGNILNVYIIIRGIRKMAETYTIPLKKN